ncbi:SH3 domain-containing protein [Croceitalea rosinachiae]|uniref:SH3 domain-containing protein n=1 Tax=Croceitalea rosinachiae TaxID=3075596 RepID=A0ABU3AB96_9FLAO|nr:SH3 domain-containing protein [Croceitalea sp. F388]MDT0607450.1 SH3 domain-containing protein [Croceitalea sp. F388]
MRYILLLLIFCSLFFSCKNEERAESIQEIETFGSKDITYPQGEAQISDAVQRKFIENHFLPWELQSAEVLGILDSFPGKKLTYLENYLRDDEWYGENKKPHKKFLREEIVNNVDMVSFPNFLKKGIVIAHTNLRRLPTNRPGFDLYSKAGEGYPFDYFQETNLWANTPLQLLHLTNDKQWCYLISPYYKGWVAMHDLAIVSIDFIEKWQTSNYAMPLSDKLNLSNSASSLALNAKMGMVLPYEESKDTNKVFAYYAITDELQNAHFLKAEVDKSLLAFDDYEFNGVHLKQLVSQLQGRPYGWGGNLENRDCSSMIRDLFATYKIWLPRDSEDQIEVGNKFELAGSIEQKTDLIKNKGIPFQTILRKKGHNMLYVGNSPNEEPLIFHAIWGLKTSYSNEELANNLKSYPIEGIHQNQDGRLSGRYIIGEAVITSVLAGAGNNGVTIPLIEEIYAMANILER